jgi:hypothetical protein
VNIKHELSPEDSKRRQENSTCFNCSETGHTVEYCKRERDTTRIKANSEKFKSEKAKRKFEETKLQSAVNPHKNHQPLVLIQRTKRNQVLTNTLVYLKLKYLLKTYRLKMN